MSVMKIAGNYNNTAKGVAVTEGGEVKTSRAWRSDVVTVYSGTPGSASATDIGTALDVSGAGAVSLRIFNGTDQDISFGFRNDINTSSSQILKDADGVYVKFTVESGTNGVVITPDDVPVLQWIKYLRLYTTCEAVPSSGTLTVYAVLKG